MQGEGRWESYQDGPDKVFYSFEDKFLLFLATFYFREEVVKEIRGNLSSQLWEKTSTGLKWRGIHEKLCVMILVNYKLSNISKLGGFLVLKGPSHQIKKAQKWYR